MGIPFKIIKIQGRSMEPSLKDGQFALLRKTKKAKLGDILVFRDPEHEKRILVKRVQALLKEGYFVIGDNISESRDSRKFGTVDFDRVIGKVIMKF